MLERFTRKAVKAIVLAQEESRRLGHSYVGYEQLLLGLMGEETGAAAQFLQRAGVNLQSARSLVESNIGQGSGNVPVEIPFTPTAQQALQHSLTLARQQGPNFSVGTEHLLWGLLQDQEEGATQVLSTLGLDGPNLTSQLSQALSGAYRTLVEDEEEFTGHRGDLSSDAIAIRLAASLLAWVEPRRLGCVATKSVRFRNSAGKVLSPDVSFISQAGQKQQDSRPDAQLVPELVAVIHSGTDWPMALQRDLFLSVTMGEVQVGFLINSNLPYRQVLILRRPSPQQRGSEPNMTNYLTQDWCRVFGDGETLSVPELLPGWELPISELWGTGV